jgi:hypothetical protein
MRPLIQLLITGLWILLPVAAAFAQEGEPVICPAIAVNCTERKPGDLFPLKCSAIVEGDTNRKNLAYQWSLSNQSPIKTDQPNEVEIDLSGKPNQTVTVTVTITGLPRDCQDSTDFISFPIKSPQDDDDDSEEEAPAKEEIQPAAQPANSIALTGSCSDVVTEGAITYFSVSTGGEELRAKPTYAWTLSRGKIKSGQGTRSILVDTTDLGGEIITANVRVEGLGAPLKLSCRTMVKRIPRAYKLDEIKNRDFNDEAARLCRFALRLSIGLDERAYLVAIGRRGQSLEEIKRAAERAQGYLINQCGVSPARIMGVNAGFGTEETLQLWVIQDGASPPETRTRIY